MKIVIDDGAFAPIRAHNSDAGLDLRAWMGAVVPARGSAIIGTGTHVELPRGCCGLLVSKSGLNTVRDITSTGLIDEGYTGQIMVKLYNHGDKDYEVKPGDKISQLVVIPVRYEPFEIVDRLEETERADAGFGSTGR